MIINSDDYLSHENYLEHYGVPGMKWGQRRKDRGGVSRSVFKEANKDAGEYARAQMFYGKGAGTRRKLIKSTVESKKARDPGYAKTFDDALSRMDMASQASGARKERGKIDRKQRNTQRAGAVARRVTGSQGTQAAVAALAMGGAAYLNSPQGRKAASTTYTKIVTGSAAAIAQKQGARAIKKMLKNM